MLDNPNRVSKVLVFEIDGRRFGLNSDTVHEILPMVTVSPMPGAPAFVEGVISIRGRVTLVLDLRSQLGLLARGPLHTDHLIVARAGESLVGLHVDRAVELIQLQDDDIEAPKGVKSCGGYVGWLAKCSDQLVPVLDLRTLPALGESKPPEELLCHSELDGSHP